MFKMNVVYKFLISCVFETCKVTYFFLSVIVFLLRLRRYLLTSCNRGKIISPPPPDKLATDRSNSVILVLFLLYVNWDRCFISYFVFCC